MADEPREEPSEAELDLLYGKCAWVGSNVLHYIQRFFINPEDGTVDAAAVITTLNIVTARYMAAIVDGTAEENWDRDLENNREMFVSQFNIAREAMKAHKEMEDAQASAATGSN
jgi:hypothetical protein